MKQDNGAPLSGRATRASTEPASSLGHSAGIPSADFTDAECSFCGVQNAPGRHIYFVEGNSGVVICEVCLLEGLSKITEAKQADRQAQLAEQAQGIEARSDETPKAVQPEGQEPDPEGDAPNEAQPLPDTSQDNTHG